jgi:hypothetical protein
VVAWKCEELCGWKISGIAGRNWVAFGEEGAKGCEGKARLLDREACHEAVEAVNHATIECIERVRKQC